MVNCNCTRQESKNLEGAPGVSNASYAAPLVSSFWEDSMKKIPLTQSQFALVDDDDCERLSKYKWHSLYNKHTDSFYAVRHVCIKESKKTICIMMHREIMNIPKGMICDHKNHDTLDNRKHNLRICTYSQNNWNKTKSKSNPLKYKGIYRGDNRYRATVSANNIKYYMGTFDTEEEAARAYNEKAKGLHGEYAKLNKIGA